MSKVITKREALQACIDGWEWQAEHPEAPSKGQNSILNKFINTCPCCHYNNTHRHHYCGNSCLIPWSGGHCIGDDSSFEKWVNSYSIEKRTKYAKQIVVLAKEALSKL